MNAHVSPYHQLWSVVDGSVADALKQHPDYLTPKGVRSARTSIVKRVTGTVLSFAVNAAKGRTVQPAETGGGDCFEPSIGEGVGAPSPHCRIGMVRFKRRTRYRSPDMFNLTTEALRRAVGEGRR